MKTILAIIALAGAVSSLAPAAPPPIIGGPAVVDVHGAGQALELQPISNRTNIVRGATNVTSIFKSTTTNFTVDAGSLMALLENSFHTNFPAGCQLLLDYTGLPPYSIVVSDSTGTNLGFNPKAVLSSSYLTTFPTGSILSSDIQTDTSPITNFFIVSGADKETKTITQSFTYDDTAMTNVVDGTKTKFTWVGLIQSKISDSSNQSNTFYNQTVSMEIIGSGTIRCPTNGLKTEIFTGSIRAKVSGFSN